MQNIEFIDIKFKNLRCHSEGYLAFKNNFLTAIVGKNGRGKSTYLMSLMAVLYGRTAEGIEIPDLVNKKLGKNLEIHLNLKVDDDKYKISRYYKHNKHSNKLILLKNEEDISRKTVSDTYDLISSILIPREVFLTIIYFSQQVKDFFTSLTDKQQKEIFNNIFQLHEYKVKYDKVFSQIKILTELLTHIEMDKIKDENTLINTQTNLEGLLNTYKNWETTKNQKLNRLKEDIVLKTKMVSDSEELKSSISFNQIEFDKLVSEIIRYNLQLTDVINQYDQLQKELDTKIEEIKSSIQKEFESKLSVSMSEINQEISFKEKDINIQVGKFSEELERLSKQLNIELNKLKEDLESKTQELKTRIKDLNNVKQSLGEDLSKINSEQRELQNLELEFEKKKAPSTKEMVTVKTIADTVKKAISGHEEKIKLFDSNPDICPTCKQKISNNEHVIKEKYKINEDIEQCNAQLESLRNRFTKAKKEYTEIENEFKDKIQKISDSITERRTDNLNKTNIVTTEIREITQKITEFEEENSVSCSHCHSKYDAEESKIKEKQSKIKIELSSLETLKKKKIETIKSKIMSDYEVCLNEQTVKVNNSINSSREDLVKKKDKLNLEIEKNEKLKISLSNNKEQITKCESIISEKNTEINSLKSQCDLISKETYDLTEIEKYKNLITKLQTQLEVVILKVREANRRIQILEFWKEGFSDRGIPSMLIDNWIPYLNDNVRSELDKVAPGKFMISFDTTSTTKAGDLREKFNINILNLETGADKHSLLSGGEKRQVDVCCMRALRKLAENLYQKHFNVCLLDEVLDSLDEENSSTFCRNLKVLSKNESIILITHSITNNAECDEIIRL